MPFVDSLQKCFSVRPQQLDVVDVFTVVGLPAVISTRSHVIGQRWSLPNHISYGQSQRQRLQDWLMEPVIHHPPPGFVRARFRCVYCGRSVEDDVEEAYSPLGQRETATTSVKCKCSAIYSVETTSDDALMSIRIVDSPDISVSIVDSWYEDDYDEFLDDYVPADPLLVYEASLDEADRILFRAEKVGMEQALLKMLYLHYIVMLEAYLSDRLIKIIMDDDQKLTALIGSTKALKDIRVPMIVIAKDPDYVRKEVKNYLQRFSFHKLSAVAKFYDAVLKVDIFGSADGAAEMNEIIERRHDLAHRNGRNKDGESFELTAEHVTRVRALANEMFYRIESVYSSYDTERKFGAAGDYPI